MFLVSDMDFDALTSTAPPQRQLPVCCSLRGLFHQVKMLRLVLVLLFSFSCLATFGPWLTNGMQKSTGMETDSSYEDNFRTISLDIVIADSRGNAAGKPSAHVSIESGCANSQSFCFPPTLSGFSSGENRIRDADLDATRCQYARPLSVGSTRRTWWASNESWLSDSVMFGILNGQTISCFLNFREGIDELSPLQIQKSKGLWLNENSEMKKSNSFNLSPSPHVPEWGQKHLYFSSVAYLTVANTCDESIIHVYEPFSNNIQFYPCNFSDLSQEPGERASKCFVFLPRWLGLSLAHLVLQTGTGEFLVQAKDYAVQSPYEISSLLCLGFPSGRWLSRNLSLFNPFDETIYVKEISAWIQLSEIIHACLWQQEDSAIGHDHHSEKAALDNQRTVSLDNRVQMPSFIKAFQTSETDEFVLGHWKSRGTANSMSVLVNHKVLFPMVQVGNHGSKWISVKIPSQMPVVMQLILNSGEIIDECSGTDSFWESPSSICLAQAEPNSVVMRGFSMAESALTEAYVVPHGTASFGSIFFHPSNCCMRRSSALIRTNLFGVEWVSLQGFGGSLTLIMLEESDTVQTIEFNLNSALPPGISPLGILFHIKEIYLAYPRQFSRELYAKNIGDLPLAVTRIEVGTDCGLDGFMVHSCKDFSLEPGESKKLLISIHAGRSGSMVQKDLKLASDGGILVIPMKANLPLYMLNYCRKSVLWIQVKKFSRAALLPASIIFLYCIFFLVMALDSQGYSYRRAKSSLGSAKSAGKSSHIKRNQKNSKLSMLAQMDNLLRLPGEGKSLKQTSTGRHRGSHDVEAEQDTISQNVTPKLGCYKQVDALLYNEKDKTDPSLSSKDIAIESSSILEASQSHDLAVKTIKEKGRKRRKRKGVNMGLMGLSEVSSSQSGNSTPTSPLSPATSVTSNPTLLASPDTDPIQATSPFSQVADHCYGKFQISEPPSAKVGTEPRVSLSYTCFSSSQGQLSVPRKNSIKPVLFPSATFPGAGMTASTLLDSSSGASASIIAPHARAPGPNQRTTKLEGKVRDKYTYDIWGDHFAGLNLMGNAKNITTMEMIATENKSNSFFVRGPQVLVTNSQPKYVSCFLQEG